jgi:amino acid transporter
MLDVVTTTEIGRFLIPTALGCLSYALATLLARIISPAPRHVYIGRLVFIMAFFVLIWVVYLPTTAIAFSGDRERWFQLRMDERGMGTAYGIHTIWVWLILALMKWPRIRHEDTR